eukprot:Awhi_evm1s4185
MSCPSGGHPAEFYYTPEKWGYENIGTPVPDEFDSVVDLYADDSTLDNFDEEDVFALGDSRQLFDDSKVR